MSDREPSSVRRCWVRLLGRSTFRARGGVERNKKKSGDDACACLLQARVHKGDGGAARSASNRSRIIILISYRIIVLISYDSSFSTAEPSANGAYTPHLPSTNALPPAHCTAALDVPNLEDETENWYRDNEF